MPNKTHSSLILDPDMLSDGFVPEQLIARDKQVAEIDRWLGLAVDTRSPKHLWIHGPSGTGKTAAVLGSINRLQRDFGVETAVINCWQHGTYFEVLDALVAEFRILRAEEHRSSLKLERIRRHLKDKQCVIVVDEVDRMPPSERSVTLYNLTQLGSVSLVCVSNHDNVLDGLDERVRSRLGPHVIPFPRYKPEELGRVLGDRAAKALVDGVIGRPAVLQIADIANGDARVGIRLLHDIVVSAEQRGQTRVSARELQLLSDQGKARQRDKVLEALTKDHRLLHGIVEERGEIASTDLWQEYLRRCESIRRRPLAVRTFSNYANRLVEAGLIASEPARVKGRVRLFRIVG